MTYFAQLGADLLSLVTEHGQWALFAILTIEEAGVPMPIPGDFILMFAGLQIAKGNLGFVAAALASIAGVSIGASVLYFLFRWGGHPFVLRFGKYFMLPKKRVDKLEVWFNKNGKTAVLIGRFIPGIRVFLSAISGLLELPYWLFLLQIVIASTLWVLFFLIAGIYLGEKWQGLSLVIAKYSYLFFVGFMASLVFYWVRHHRT
jgi:membrane protein DedA with SNARE-associated domain